MNVGTKDCDNLSEGYTSVEMYIIHGNVLEDHLAMGRGFSVATCK